MKYILITSLISFGLNTNDDENITPQVVLVCVCSSPDIHNLEQISDELLGLFSGLLYIYILDIGIFGQNVTQPCTRVFPPVSRRKECRINYFFGGKEIKPVRFL